MLTCIIYPWRVQIAHFLHVFDFLQVHVWSLVAWSFNLHVLNKDRCPHGHSLDGYCYVPSLKYGQQSSKVSRQDADVSQGQFIFASIDISIDMIVCRYNQPKLCIRQTCILHDTVWHVNNGNFFLIWNCDFVFAVYIIVRKYELPRKDPG